MSSIATCGKEEEGEQCSNLCNMNNTGGTETTKHEETEADGSKGLSCISDEALIKHIMLRKKRVMNTHLLLLMSVVPHAARKKEKAIS